MLPEFIDNIMSSLPKEEVGLFTPLNEGFGDITLSLFTLPSKDCLIEVEANEDEVINFHNLLGSYQPTAGESFILQKRILVMHQDGIMDIDGEYHLLTFNGKMN